MNKALNKLVQYELRADNQVSEMETALQGLTAAQLTLLNVNMASDAREFQHGVAASRRQRIA